MVNFGIRIRKDGKLFHASCQRLGVQVSAKTETDAIKRARDEAISVLRQAIVDLGSITSAEEHAEIEAPAFYSDEYAEQSEASSEDDAPKAKTKSERRADCREAAIDNRAKILAYAKQKKKFTNKEIIELLQSDSVYASNLLARMEKMKTIKRIDRGLYAIAE